MERRREERRGRYDAGRSGVGQDRAGMVGWKDGFQGEREEGLGRVEFLNV